MHVARLYFGRAAATARPGVVDGHYNQHAAVAVVTLAGSRVARPILKESIGGCRCSLEDCVHQHRRKATDSRTRCKCNAEPNQDHMVATRQQDLAGGRGGAMAYPASAPCRVASSNSSILLATSSGAPAVPLASAAAAAWFATGDGNVPAPAEVAGGITAACETSAPIEATQFVGDAPE